MSAGRDFLLFILFMVALGIAWFFTGGPERTISHAGWFLTPGEQGITVPSVGLHTSSSSFGGSSDAFGNTNQAQNQQSIWDYFFNYHAGTGEVGRPADSPYAKYVSFFQGSTVSADPAKEYVIIRTNSQLPNSITITGWTMESAQSGLTISIGDAAQIPFLGGLNSKAPVTIGPNSNVKVITGSSPNGVSFRLNKCTGYFNQFQTFTPALPSECPRPEDEMLAHPEIAAGNQTCQDFVRNLPQCRLALNALPGNIGGLCQDFILNTLSYNGCVTAHQQDPDFYRNEWRIYLNRNQELWSNSHDAIRLLDENGLLVGEISY